MIQHRYAARNPHHEVHVMLDQEDGDAPKADARDQAIEFLDLGLD